MHLYSNEEANNLGTYKDIFSEEAILLSKNDGCHFLDMAEELP